MGESFKSNLVMCLSTLYSKIQLFDTLHTTDCMKKQCYYTITIEGRLVNS